MGLKKCILYLAGMGFVFFIVGRILPQSWFVVRFLPNNQYLQLQKKFYRLIRIRDWQNRLPDMSRILPGLMPRKKLLRGQALSLMIHETFVAEFVHVLLALLGCHCLRLWPGPGGITVTLLNFLGNLPFILVQRYNRPRLIRLEQALHTKDIQN